MADRLPFSCLEVPEEHIPPGHTHNVMGPVSHYICRGSIDISTWSGDLLLSQKQLLNRRMSQQGFESVRSTLCKRQIGTERGREKRDISIHESV